MGQCNFSIAPAIYHFLILHISFANLKNFGFLRLHLHSRFINFSQSVGIAWLIYNRRSQDRFKSFAVGI